MGEHHDLYLIDVNMPKMDGYKLVEAMRAEPELAATPVIMVSTEAEGKDEQLAYAAGANLYIVKPADGDTLQKYATLLAGAV